MLAKLPSGQTLFFSIAPCPNCRSDWWQLDEELANRYRLLRIYCLCGWDTYPQLRDPSLRRIPDPRGRSPDLAPETGAAPDSSQERAHQVAISGEAPEVPGEDHSRRGDLSRGNGRRRGPTAPGSQGIEH